MKKKNKEENANILKNAGKTDTKVTLNIPLSAVPQSAINDKVEEILKDLSVIDCNGNYIDRVEDYIIDSEDEKRAYLKGVFLATGSINDPKTSRYHLEFLIDNKVFFNKNFTNYFPIQKSRKMTSKSSSTSMRPVIRPKARADKRKSSVFNSNSFTIKADFKCCTHSCKAAR